MSSSASIIFDAFSVIKLMVRRISSMPSVRAAFISPRHATHIARGEVLFFDSVPGLKPCLDALLFGGVRHVEAQNLRDDIPGPVK